MTTPDKVWLDWPQANRGEPVFDNPPENGFQAGQTCYVRRDPAVLAELPEVQALIRAETERCAGIADKYHAQAMEWAKSQDWLKGHTGETDSSRIAAAIREGRG